MAQGKIAIMQEGFAGVVARVESPRGRMSEGERQVEGLFESLLAEAFNGRDIADGLTGFGDQLLCCVPTDDDGILQERSHI